MAKAVLGTGHQAAVNLMRDVPLQLDTICGRLKTDVHCTNGHDSTPNSHAWPETNNNTDYESVLFACKVDKMRDQSAVTVSDNGHLGDMSDQETVCGGQKRHPEAGVVINGEVPEGRKRRRKNCQPRSLMQLNHRQDTIFFKEELEDYRVNNNGVDFDAIADDEEEVLDLSCGKKQEDTSTTRSINSGRDSDKHVTDDAIVDLSVVTLGDNKALESTEDRTRFVDSVAMDTTTDDDEDGDDVMEMTETTTFGSDAAVAIKDYAESTMNELLSIYGLNEDEAGESITRRVPLQNFTPNNILGREKPKFTSPSPSLTFSTTCLVKNRSDAPTTSMETNMRDSAAVSLASEGIYAKFMDSMEKLTKIPQGSIIGSPPALLPTKISMLPGLSDAPIASASHLAVTTATAVTNISPFQAKPTVASSFSTSSGYIKACFDPPVVPKLAGLVSPDRQNMLPNYGKYMKRYQCGENCGQKSCSLMAYKEHFHCLDCDFKVFVRKEEMIRHFKWHKKRDDSLQHGFMRYSPLDRCEGKFGSCTHDGRQTHYHCLQPGCNKVYISTSDVQMHANYHRKNTAIAQEGFQRFRATEDCGSLQCVFYGQRTTHFHCRRPQCNYTFKNKADMEKHKMYHQKDEMLAKDGFKKFMKYESCGYDSCRYSNSSNHIHCIRPGCDYVLHSTGQLYSHKRKHERRDFELAYKSFKTHQHPAKIAPTPTHQPVKVPTTKSQQSPVVGRPRLFSSEEFIDIEDLAAINQSGSMNESDSSSPRALSTAMDLSLPGTPGSSVEAAESGKILLGMLQSEENHSPLAGSSCFLSLEQLVSTMKGEALGDSLNLSIPNYDDNKHSSVEEAVNASSAAATSDSSSPDCDSAVSQPGVVASASVPSVNDRREKNELWKKYLTRYTANDPCFARCELLYKDHYHCSVTGCGKLFRSKDGVHEHAKCHEQQERITTLCYMTYDTNISCDASCPYNRRQIHYHCLWVGCKQVLTEEDPVFSRLDHQKVHEYARGVVSRRIFPSTPRVPLDAMRRRRGRPPKFPHSLIPIVPKAEMSEEEIQRLVLSLEGDTEAQLVVRNGFKKFDPDNVCPDSKCMFATELKHYHCVRRRCYYATNRCDMLNLHARDFHSFINILDGFEFFDRSVDCRRVHCHNNHVRRHFHCVRPRCDYSFVRYSTMIQHDKKHNMANMERSLLFQRKSMAGVNGSLSAVMPQASDLSKVATTKILGTMVHSSSKPQSLRPLIPLTVPSRAAQPNALSQSPGGTAAVAMATVAPIVIQSINSSPVVLTSSSVVNVSSNLSSGVIPATSMSTHKNVNSGVPVSTVSSTLLMINNPQLSSSSNLVTIAPKPSASSALPLAMLLQQQQQRQQQQHQNRVNMMSPQLSWLTQKMNMHYGMHQNCSRPFCKLKKKDHYHCCECNQAFSNPIRLKMHVAKHSTKTASTTAQYDTSPLEVTPDAGTNDTNVGLSSSLSLSLTTFSNLLNKEQHTLHDDTDDDDSDGLVIDLSLPTSECGDSCTTAVDDDKGDVSDVGHVERQHDVTKEHDVAIPPEMQPISIGRRQDGVPEGYVRFRHIEDCGFTHCTYRHTVTHYHCDRPTCGHAFSDRARTQQHTKRHQRTDAIMSDDFVHFRIHIDCQRTHCEHACVTSHYHCQQCLFACTDTAKVIAHRKHHFNLKKVAVQGYRKFTKRQACSFESCSFSGKQCHYHCLEAGCVQAMLGAAQMTAHKKRHSDTSLHKEIN